MPLLFLLLLGGPARAQVAFEGGVGFLFNTTDILMDNAAGISLTELGLSAKLSFQTRLGTKRVLVESDTPDVLYQYHERRYMLGIEADKRLKLTDLGESLELGGYLGGFAGMRFADYRGTDSKADLGFGWEATGGAYLSNPKGFILRMGYHYIPLPTYNVIPHRLGITFCVLISDE